MRMRRVRGRSMIDALRRVKEELGENAVILDSEKVTDNGVDYYEVIAAIDEAYDQKDSEAIETERILGPSYDERVGYFQGGERILSELKEIKAMLSCLATPQLKLKREIELLRLRIPSFIVDRILLEDVDLVTFVGEAYRRKGACLEERFRIFIGEPGVGKTSVLFKIAFKLREEAKGRVVVVSVDNYKVGSKEQFQKLAQFLEIPFFWMDWEELVKRSSALKAESDYLLVDTPGLGKRFMVEDLAEVSKILRECRFSWVVKATNDYYHDLRLWTEIRSFPINELVLTFVDSVKWGGALFWLLEEDIPPLSYFSIGERIPEDLRRVEPSDVISLLLRGMKK